MKKYRGKELVAFLSAVDRHLARPFRIELIGAAAAILAFKIKRGTLDIDSTNDLTKIRKACEAASAETGLQIPLQTVGIYDAPYEYESRLKHLSIPKLKNLQLLVPEKHDWALIKMMRLNQKDLDDIEEVFHHVGFSKEKFSARFLEEMTHVHGNRKDVIANFLTMMEQLFGKAEADRLEEKIRAHKKWK